MPGQVWFITGTSTGFGRYMADCVLQKGGRVVATLRKPEVLADMAARWGKDQLLIVKLDVTNTAEIISAFEEAKRAFGRVDVVFNNAAMALVGEAEASSEEVGRKLFDTNYWAAVNVSIQAIKFFRDVNPAGAGGRLLQNSSMAGLEPVALLSTYVAGKHALEGFTKTFVTELDPAWNIKITLIEPGFFQTDITKQAAIMPLHPQYTSDNAVMVREVMKVGDLPGDIVKGVETIYKVAQLDEPPLHFPLGMDGVLAMKRAGQIMTETAEKYESWSQDLLKSEMGDSARIIKDAYQ